jgi:hypothetical protein
MGIIANGHHNAVRIDNTPNTKLITAVELSARYCVAEETSGAAESSAMVIGLLDVK